MNLRRPLAMFDPVGCEILLVRVPAGVIEALFWDTLCGLSFWEEFEGLFSIMWRGHRIYAKYSKGMWMKKKRGEM